MVDLFGSVEKDTLKYIKNSRIPKLRNSVEKCDETVAIDALSIATHIIVAYKGNYRKAKEDPMFDEVGKLTEKFKDECICNKKFIE